MSRMATHNGAAARLELPSGRAVLELLKPITWFPPMWAFICGVVSSGVAFQDHWGALITGVVLCGPLLCAASQAVNDWFDRHVDALNEPGRPIPSGRIPGRWGLWIAMGWTALSLAVAAQFGAFVLAAAVLGCALSWAYSAPPVRLKQNGWWGNAACGVCYEGFAWVTGAAVMLGAAPGAHILIVAALYSAGAHGIMTLNDFKSVEGDRCSGVGSLPVRLGVPRAARVACIAMAAPQLVVIVLLCAWRRELHAAAVGVLLCSQCLLMRRLVAEPRARAPWYGATGVSLYVLGMLIAAFALRAHA